MGISTALAGRVYPATAAYEVSREKIREFALAVGSAHPAHGDPVAARNLGYPDLVAPVTFVVIIAQRAEARVLADPDSGVDFARLVHAEERIVHHRPIVAGDRLTAVAQVEKAHEVGGHGMLLTRVEISDRTGAAVSTVRSTVVIRAPGSMDAPPPSPAPQVAQAPPDETPVKHETPVKAGPRPRRADVRVGQRLGGTTVPLRRVDLIRYAGASGDFNVIHWSGRAARAVGLPDVIAHGMLTLGVAGRWVGDWAGDPGAVLACGAKFTQPVVVPDDDHGAQLELGGVVAALDEPAGAVRVDLTATCAGGAVLGRAQAVVRLA